MTIYWLCPKCNTCVEFPNEGARDLAAHAGGCQGCRAKATLEEKPELTRLFVDFWARYDAWPQSLSWTSVLPEVA